MVASRSEQNQALTHVEDNVHTITLVLNVASTTSADLTSHDDPSPFEAIAGRKGVKANPGSNTITVTLAPSNVEVEMLMFEEPPIQWLVGISSDAAPSPPQGVSSDQISATELEITVQNGNESMESQLHGFRLSYLVNDQPGTHDPILIELPAGGPPAE